MRPAVAVVALLLASCSQKPELIVPDMPETVEVAVDRYVALPAELTAPCRNEAPKAQTYAEAKRLALVRNEYLIECDSRMEKIRALQPEVQP